MNDDPVAQIQAVLDSLLPGLLGVRLVSPDAQRGVAELDVKPQLCTTGGGLHGPLQLEFGDRGDFDEIGKADLCESLAKYERKEVTLASGETAWVYVYAPTFTSERADVR